jgi:hypothetical protein
LLSCCLGYSVVCLLRELKRVLDKLWVGRADAVCPLAALWRASLACLAVVVCVEASRACVPALLLRRCGVLC